MFDVIVCGAGPAGSVAATVLARRGARVLLVDRARFPRDKLCGDTLNPGTLRILDRLELRDPIGAKTMPIEGMIVSGENGARIRASYGDGARGASLLRRDLDFALAEAAVRSDARMEEGVLVRRPLVDETSGAPRVRGVVIAGANGQDLRVPAPLVIAADGRRSRLALALGLIRQPPRPRRWAIGAYFEGVDGMSAFGEMHVRRGCYVGVAPLPGGLANICYVSETTDDFSQPAGALWAGIRRDPELAARCAKARMVTTPRSLGPLAVDATACGVPGLLLAGDAAGFIDPMTGDGLRFAIQGGELAAQAAFAALADGRAAHHRLAASRRRTFAGKHRFNRTLRALVAAPRAVSAASAAARVAPWAIRHLVDVAGDVTL
ncbi:MAG TPA: NAD(P)/FAD-dependent oxidoreductase [Vicinamibacterales bacterium]|nr:NAD(P)/FAD-dependent oxidoreductase [Vicinamibacterales bacterium]